MKSFLRLQHCCSFLFAVCIASCITSCVEHIMDVPYVVDLSGTEARLNVNATALSAMTLKTMNDIAVSSFSIEKDHNEVSYYRIGFEDNDTISLYPEVAIDNQSVPHLSVELRDGVYYWALNGQIVNGWPTSIPIVFEFDGTTWSVNSLGQNTTKQVAESEYMGRDVKVDYCPSSENISFSLYSGTQLVYKCSKYFDLLRHDVLNEVYYKDLFLDAGAGLTSRKSLYAANALGLSVEGISFARAADNIDEISLQQKIIGGDKSDINGRLLYPDGQPRYKLLFVNGGSSTTHGKTLGEQGLKRMREFVMGGGSYVGTCAGAFIASCGYDSNNDYPYYLHLWPGNMLHTGIKNSYTDMTLIGSSPLLNYCDYGGDYFIEHIRHNGGGYPEFISDSTEVLALYHCPDVPNIHQRPCIWAYKHSATSGRLVLEGSHPEELSGGEGLDLTKSMISYAIDGRGIVPVKGFLENLSPILMDKQTSENLPLRTRIGDYQCHHFAMFIPYGAHNIKVKVDSPSDCDLCLMMSYGTYAFPSNSVFKTNGHGGHQELEFASLTEGMWYVSVLCETTVAVAEVEYGQDYHGKVECLNGYPYSIVSSWDSE